MKTLQFKKCCRQILLNEVSLLRRHGRETHEFPGLEFRAQCWFHPLPGRQPLGPTLTHGRHMGSKEMPLKDSLSLSLQMDYQSQKCTSRAGWNMDKKSLLKSS